MRRSDREVKKFEDIVAIMEKCDVCRVCLHDDEYPYILPLNFGMTVQDGKIELYFHGAMKGTKYDLIEKDNRASFEMDCGHQLMLETETGNCTMLYESVIGQGRVHMIPDGETLPALHAIMRHYHQEDFPFNEAMVPRTRVFKLVVENVTGKIRASSPK